MAADTNQPEDFVGATVTGENAEYRIISAIGAGGMGSVFLGETIGTGRKVAVKFLHAELTADDSSSRERFEREMRVLQDLKAFRGIVQFEDGGKVESGQMFLVMEYVAAPTLDKIISENTNGLPQIRAIQILVEILSVLEPIHHRRFVHRDLKPHNICVYEEPLAVRLLDFGLSKPYMEGLGYEKVTRRMQGKGSEIPGSPHYMAVEQFLRPKEVDARTDIYSCGIILYELLAGIPPFRGIYLQDILQQHKENAPPPIESSADGGPISYRLWAVIEKALSKNAESRYQSAAEFKEALYDVLNVLNKRKRPKKELDGKYRMIKKIGVGGNSEVFEVESREDSQRYAMKIAREGASDWDEETLMNEADRALNHENIVKIFEFGSFEGRPALAMELLEGGSVEDILDQYKESGFPENVFYRTMIDICRGLHHAHQKNIVHRDVKPGNMLRSLEGRIKVCDFGIAKRFEQQGEEMQGAKNTTLAKGTAQYISPEQCDLSGRVDRRADIYCLGVMMYEILAGELPFTDGILIMQHLQTNPPPLFVKGEFRNPDELCKIVEKAMQKSPDQRYQSMKELAQDLVRVSKLEPQKKSHKAVPLETIPEEWKDDPSRMGSAATGQTQYMEPVQTGMSGKKVALIVASVVVVLVGGFIFINSQKEPEKSNPTVITDSDPAKAEFEKFRGLLESDGPAAVESFDFTELAEGSDERGQLGGMLLSSIRNNVFLVPVNAENVGQLTDDLGTALNAVAHADPANTVLDQARAFADQAKAFVSAAAVTAGEWKDWNGDDEGKVRAVLKALNQADTTNFPQDRWLDYLTEQQAAVWSNNLTVAVDGIGSMGAVWSEETESRVKALLARDAAAKAKVLDAIRKWAEADLKKSGSLDELASFMTGGVAPAAGLAVENLESIAGLDAVRQARTLMSSGIKPQTRQQAASFALADAAADGDLMKNMASWLESALGADPTMWSTNAAAITQKGVSLSLFAPAVVQSVEALLASDEFSNSLKTSMESMSSTQRDQLAARHDGMRDGLLALASIQPSDEALTELKNSWASTYKAYRRSADGAWQALKADVASLKPDTDAARIFAVMDSLQSFLKDYEGAEENYAGEVKAIIGRQAQQLQSSGHPLVMMGFAKRYATSLDFLAQALENEGRRRLADELLKDKAPRAANYLEGDAVKYVNNDWPESDDMCINSLFDVNDVLAPYAATKSIEIKGADGAEISIEENGTRLRLKGAPSALYKNQKQADGTLNLVVRLVLSAPKLGVASESVTLVLDGPTIDEYDFEDPVFGVTFGDVSNGAATMTVKVTETNPGTESAPTLMIGGKVVPMSGGKGTYSAKLTLQNGLGGGDAVELSKVDDFGNEGKATNASWATRIKSLRSEVVADELARVDSAFRSEVSQMRSLSTSSMRRGKSAIESAKGGLDAMNRYDSDATRKAAQGIFDQGVAAARGWFVSGQKESDLNGMKADFDAYFAALDNLGTLASKSASAEKGTVWSRLMGQAKSGTTSSTNTTNTPTGPDYSRYSKAESVQALGLTFYRVEVGGKPAWVADVEVSQGFAKQYDSSLIRAVDDAVTGDDKLSKKDSLPLAPLSPRNAQKLVDAINRQAGSGLRGTFGDNVRVDIPSSSVWEAAARLHNGGSGYAFGGTSIPSRYRYSKFRVNRARWYDGLKDVASEGAGKFDFLSGNVSEIVRRGSGFGTKGGSMEDACYSEKYKFLRLETSPRRLSRSRVERFSGLRLAIVPVQ